MSGGISIPPGWVCLWCLWQRCARGVRERALNYGPCAPATTLIHAEPTFRVVERDRMTLDLDDDLSTRVLELVLVALKHALRLANDEQRFCQAAELWVIKQTDIVRQRLERRLETRGRQDTVGVTIATIVRRRGRHNTAAVDAGRQGRGRT